MKSFFMGLQMLVGLQPGSVAPTSSTIAPAIVEALTVSAPGYTAHPYATSDQGSLSAESREIENLDTFLNNLKKSNPKKYKWLLVVLREEFYGFKTIFTDEKEMLTNIMTHDISLTSYRQEDIIQNLSAREIVNGIANRTISLVCTTDGTIIFIHNDINQKNGNSQIEANIGVILSDHWNLRCQSIEALRRTESTDNKDVIKLLQRLIGIARGGQNISERYIKKLREVAEELDINDDELNGLLEILYVMSRKSHAPEPINHF